MLTHHDSHWNNVSLVLLEALRFICHLDLANPLENKKKKKAFQFLRTTTQVPVHLSSDLNQHVLYIKHMTKKDCLLNQALDFVISVLLLTRYFYVHLIFCSKCREFSFPLPATAQQHSRCQIWFISGSDYLLPKQCFLVTTTQHRKY